MADSVEIIFAPDTWPLHIHVVTKHVAANYTRMSSEMSLGKYIYICLLRQCSQYLRNWFSGKDHRFYCDQIN